MNSRTCGGIAELEKPGMIIRQPPIRQKIRKTRKHRLRLRLAHEIEPSELISTPRAISTCESTGSDGNMRSMIMRT